MKPAPFDLHRPSRLEDALTLLAAHADEAKLIAGGQSLVPVMNLRLATPPILIDLTRLDALRGVSVKDDMLVIGAAVRQAELLGDPLIARHAPLLRAATRHVGHVQTRARGTIGGSVAHADPAAELPTALVALGATMTARSVRGARDIPASDFFTGALTTALGHDEILCAISVPCAPADTCVAFREIARRHGDFAVASAAVQRDGDDGAVVAALGGVLPAPHLCTSLDGAVSEGRLDPVRLATAIAEELRPLEPMSDVFASGEYRMRIATVLLTEALEEVLSHD